MLNISIYLFGNYYVKGILQESEKEKIVLMINTLEPTLTLNIFLEQKHQLDTTLKNILNFNAIETIKLKVNHQKKIVYFNKNRTNHHLLFNYATTIKDPLLGTTAATLELTYSNKHLEEIHRRVLTTLGIIFIISLIVYILFYL